MTINSVSQGLNAEQIFNILDNKDGHDGFIYKNLWDQFRATTGVKADTIGIRIGRQRGIISIRQYLKNATEEVKKAIADFCGISYSANSQEEPTEVTNQTKSETTDNTSDESIKKSTNSSSGTDLSEYQVSDENWGRNWIENNSKYAQVAANTQNFDKYFEEASEKYNVPKSVLQAICMKETTMGYGKTINNVMQLEPQTAKAYGCYDRSDIKSNIMASAKFLGELIEKSNGDIGKALVGYNHGPYSEAYKNYNGMPYTDKYANKVLSLAKAYENMA